jgi:hypothetical protein
MPYEKDDVKVDLRCPPKIEVRQSPERKLKSRYRNSRTKRSKLSAAPRYDRVVRNERVNIMQKVDVVDHGHAPASTRERPCRRQEKMGRYGGGYLPVRHSEAGTWESVAEDKSGCTKVPDLPT